MAEDKIEGVPYEDLGLLGIIIDAVKRNSDNENLLSLVDKIENDLKNAEKDECHVEVNNELETLTKQLNDYLSVYKEETKGWK